MCLETYGREFTYLPTKHSSRWNIGGENLPFGISYDGSFTYDFNIWLAVPFGLDAKIDCVLIVVLKFNSKKILSGYTLLRK